MSREEDILRHAAIVFERQGVRSTSFEDIAQAVGIKREAIYYYFKSRDEILFRILLPQAAALNQGLESILNSGQPAPDKLRAAIRHHLSSFDPSTYIAMTVALREDHFPEIVDDTEQAAELRELWRANGRLWTALIEQGQAEGAFNPDLSAKIVAFGILGMCNWLARWFNPRKGLFSLKEIVEIFSTFALRGVVARGGKPGKDSRRAGNTSARIAIDHPLRAVQAIVNECLSEMAEELQVLKPINGQPSIPHEMLLRTMLLQALYSLHSERPLMDQLEFNQLFRWFVGLPDDVKTWNAMVFKLGRERLLRRNVSVRFLDLVMKRAAEAGLLSNELFSVDPALLKRWKAPTPKPYPVARASSLDSIEARRKRSAR